MLYNLLSNAVKFTSSGGKVTVESEFEDEFVKISVTDTGAGIREQDLGLIFEEFRQAGGTGGVGRDGTGLGLAITPAAGATAWGKNLRHQRSRHWQSLQLYTSSRAGGFGSEG